MNKRIKIKKGILNKKCDHSCNLFKAIYDCSLITNLGCESCKFSQDETIEKVMEENNVNNTKYKRISQGLASHIIEKRNPLGLFWTMEKGLYIAIDNLTGDAWCEDFKTREECFEYLSESVPYHLQCFSPD